MLKKLMIFLLVVLLAQYFWPEQQHPIESDINVTPLEQQASVSLNPEPKQVASPFRCDGRQHCSQMTSKAEAEFFLANCPNTKMDGDNDGVPCERQFAEKW